MILKNVTYIDYITLKFKKSNIKVNTGIDAGIEFIDKISDNEKNIIDCSGKYVTKSFAVGHHHAYSALATGMPALKKTPKNFYEILKYIWWKIDKILDKDMIEASALVTAIACAKAGSTFAIDHHASPYNIKGSLDIIANAFDKVGVSHLLCYEVSGRDGLCKATSGLEENEDYLKSNQGLIGLHASFTVLSKTLKKAVHIAQKYNTGIHIHVAEDKYDQEYTLKKFNKRVVERLNDAGVLESSKTILAHCIHINKEERKLIKKSPVYIAQNTESNLNNNVGFFNSHKLKNKVMLGTDGMHSDMLRSAKYSFFAGKTYDNIDFGETYKRLRRVNDYIVENEFKGDSDNNLIVLDYNPHTYFNEANFLSHFMFGINSNHIEHVISNGKLIVENRKLTTVDENEIMKFSKEQANRLWEGVKN